MSFPIRRVSIALLLFALFAGGMAVRRQVLNAQYRLYGRTLPFTLESALTFRYVRMVAEHGALPNVDLAVQYPDGVKVFETYSIALEYVWGRLAGILPKKTDLAERVRWVSEAWFCMGIVFLFAWLYFAWGSLAGAGFGAACYAVSLASVIRSTGQELSDENFALPLVLGAFAACAWARRRPRFAEFVLGATLSSLLLAWALTAWDLVQVVVLFGAAAGMAIHLRDRLSERVWLHWLLALASLIIAGFLNPYLKAHHFLLSYGMLLAYATTASRLLWIVLSRFCAKKKINAKGAVGFLGRLVSVLGVSALGAWLASGYAETYGHFIELLWAKIRFCNSKPADPALLTFDQAILWTPALNSATFRLTYTLFPATLFTSALAMGWAFKVCRRCGSPLLATLLAASLVAWPAFILFERFHVFVAILSAAWFGWLAWQVCLFRPAARWLLFVVLVYALSVEANQVLAAPERWGRRDYFQQKQELVDWFRSQSVSEPTLANFGLSGTLLTYADCPILLHPKFENVEIRRLVEGYGRALFLGDELVFRDWAEARGACYYVHSMGEFAGTAPELQMRYFVKALYPSSTSAARLLEYAPDDSRYFVLMYNNIKYSVYRIITASDERRAASLIQEAAECGKRGNIGLAENLATLAMQYDPRSEKVRRFLLDLNRNEPGNRPATKL